MKMTLTLHGEPLPQPRHKVGVFNGKARTYLSSKEPIRDFKHQLKCSAVEAMNAAGVETIDAPISMECLFLMPRPKRLIWKKRAMPRQPHISRPDTDNLVKGVKDALTGIVYRDDSLIWNEKSTKEYAAGGELPQTVVVLEW